MTLNKWEILYRDSWAFLESPSTDCCKLVILYNFTFAYTSVIKHKKVFEQNLCQHVLALMFWADTTKSNKLGSRGTTGIYILPIDMGTRMPKTKALAKFCLVSGFPLTSWWWLLAVERDCSFISQPLRIR